MNYIDDKIKILNREIRHLQKQRLQLKKHVQDRCSHINIVRSTVLPRFSYRDVDPTSPVATIKYKVKTHCKDCGKVFK